MARTLVTAWHGTYVLDGDQEVREFAAPLAVPELVTRGHRRQTGGLTPEEERALASRGTDRWVTRDRRLAGSGVALDPDAPLTAPREPDRAIQRAYLLQLAEERLKSAWDPSIHLEEAVRAVRDLDRASNLIGERLASWVGRDGPEFASEDPERAARAMREPPPPTALGPTDPRLAEGRRRLGELYDAMRTVREQLDAAIAGSVPEHTPNLHALLGAELSGLLIAQAGGLDRLARLPASTIQVLGAERAFFEHLRGRAPPPRHGLLFQHPQIQSSPRTDRGKLARALAGKVAIAARLDQSGSPVAPGLLQSFQRREAEVRARRSAGRGKRRVSPST